MRHAANNVTELQICFAIQTIRRRVSRARAVRLTIDRLPKRLTLHGEAYPHALSIPHPKRGLMPSLPNPLLTIILPADRHALSTAKKSPGASAPGETTFCSTVEEVSSDCCL
ncbi:hypothetical protein AWB75_03959 [Caballeronia catudaia]|uniref:Uncharacterized protein n=1 Tax=Caballeronia catudaia TaxID=1777136 RepID=A0A158BSP4_9BURK|nr:hypothetical protein [Caballeronia catudaia]SAK73095.1 hypothetical protein AWB75_03959 [Caballeronia catudaia]